MAIVSISKIQHRYGRHENVPQLSAAELGYSINTRQLFIGNGPVSEGAPMVGNTEILTEHSDLLNFADRFTYRGERAGYTHLTGTDANTPISRTLQRKSEESVSVLDFGAKGDGVTDDTAAINRAFFQLFCRENNEEIRRSLLFPAGVYVTSDTIKIPPFARVIGEGKESSIIRRETNPGVVFELSDSRHNIGVDIGNNGGSLPSYVEIYSISFHNDTTSNVAEISSASFCRFESVKFRGYAATTPVTVGTGVAGVKINSTAVAHSKNLAFVQCDFTNNVFGVVADDDMSGITLDGCYFFQLLKGVKLGESTSGTGASVDGPRGFRVINSQFDKIYSVGFHSYQISGVTSAFNHYQDVGNSTLGVDNPVINIVIFEGDDCVSVFDVFDRPLYARVTVPPVEFGDNVVLVSDTVVGISHGSARKTPGMAVTLDNDSVDEPSGIGFDTSTTPAAAVHYQLRRGDESAAGVLYVAASSSGSAVDDTRAESMSLGVTFGISVASGVASIDYTATDTGDDIQMKYNVEYFA